MNGRDCAVFNTSGAKIHRRQKMDCSIVIRHLGSFAVRATDLLLATASISAAPDAASLRHRRKVLCVFPSYTPSFGTFEYAYPIKGRVFAFMPPQGILVVAAYLPKAWEVRFVDENIRRVTDAEFAWADAVFVSGMHIQRRQTLDINERAHRFGKPTALGGPSVSACPDHYPEFDYLHIGELGDPE